MVVHQHSQTSVYRADWTSEHVLCTFHPYLCGTMETGLYFLKQKIFVTAVKSAEVPGDQTIFGQHTDDHRQEEERTCDGSLVPVKNFGRVGRNDGTG